MAVEQNSSRDLPSRLPLRCRRISRVRAAGPNSRPRRDSTVILITAGILLVFQPFFASFLSLDLKNRTYVLAAAKRSGSIEVTVGIENYASRRFGCIYPSRKL